MKRVIAASKTNDFIYVILRNGDPIAKGSYDAVYKKANNMSVPVDIKKFSKSKFNSYFKMAKEARRPNPLKFAVNRYINDNRDEYREINSATNMKRIIKASLDNSKFYYLITVGSGLAWPYLYIIETEDSTTDYGYLVDELIDYLDTNSPERLIDPSSVDAEYTWGEDEDGNECLVEINNPYEVAFYEDSYTVGGNYGKILLHYGQFNIREIDETAAKKYVKENNATLIEV